MYFLVQSLLLLAAFQDYVMVERVFNVMYQPQNVYCFTIDSKSDPMFKERVRNLASCFPNVVVPEEEMDMKSSGVNTSAAHLSCMRALQPFKWNYLVLLQVSGLWIYWILTVNGASAYRITTFPYVPMPSWWRSTRCLAERTTSQH